MARAASSTLAVPPTLIEASKAGSATDLRTSIWAARWKIASGAAPAATSATAARSRMSSSTSLAPFASAPSRFSRRPVERSSTTVTASPRASSASTRFEPMKPAPPVTKQSIGPPILEGSARGRRSSAAEPPCYSRPPMRLIVTEKNNSAKKIADILGAPTGGPSEDKSFKVPYLHVDRRRRPRAPHDRPQGPRARPGLPRGLLELAEDRPARSDRRRADQGADRQKRRQSDQEGRQGSGRARDRDRLRPRGRADRPRGARGDARGEPGARLPRGEREGRR